MLCLSCLICCSSLPTLQGGQPESPGITQLRDIASGDGSDGGWLLDEQGAFANVEPDRCDGFETFNSAVEQVGCLDNLGRRSVAAWPWSAPNELQNCTLQGALQASPWELAEAIAAYLTGDNATALLSSAWHACSCPVRLCPTFMSVTCLMRAESTARYVEGKDRAVHALLELAVTPQLTAHRPPGDAQLVLSLLTVAAGGEAAS